MVMTLQVQPDLDAIADFCRRHHIFRLSVFGSVLREDFSPASDVDVLVEFEPGKTPGLAYFGLGEELAEVFGRKVDYAMPQEIHPRIRAQVLRDAEVLYAA